MTLRLPRLLLAAIAGAALLAPARSAMAQLATGQTAGQITGADKKTGSDVSPGSDSQMLNRDAVKASDAATTADQPPPAPGEFRYTVVLEGQVAELKGVADDIRASATLFKLSDRPVPARFVLEKRLDLDRALLRRLMDSRGYYGARITGTIGEGAEPRVTLNVDPGPLYRLGKLTVLGTEGSAADPELMKPIEANLKPGDPAVASAVLSAEATFLARLRDAGHLAAKVEKRDAVVDHATRTLDVTWRFDPGPLALAGPVTVTPVEGVDSGLIAGRVDLKRGEVLNRDRLDELRGDLNDLGVFSTVQVSPDATKMAADGSVPVNITLGARKKHTIGASANFASDTGGGVEGHWTDRNLWGGAESLELSAGLGRLSYSGVTTDTEYQAGATLTVPDALTSFSKLSFATRVLSENPDAYRRKAWENTLRQSQRFSGGWTGSVGATAIYQSVKDRTDDDDDAYEDLIGGNEGDKETVRSWLLGLPVALRQDTTDSLLDPTEGFRLTVGTTPYKQIGGSDTQWWLLDNSASSYVDLGRVLNEEARKGRIVAAGRVRLANILGSSLDKLPANQRLFAGGGGSVRGYKFQSVGPLDSHDDPLGGRSAIELNSELRIKVTDSIGIVPFVDAGNVDTSSFPKFQNDVAIGTGLGLRYYSPVGPIRADFAVPLTKRPSDDPWELYISLGQAF